jgi:hypothetical protein
MSFMMHKLAMINSCEIILEKKNIFFAKNHCEIQVHPILVCALYSIKYVTLLQYNVFKNWFENSKIKYQNFKMLKHSLVLCIHSLGNNFR